MTLGELRHAGGQRFSVSSKVASNLPNDSGTDAEADRFDETASSFTFRPIHYLGSKLRVLPAIERAIDRMDPSLGPVCDLFSGSASVSRYLSRRRRVMAVDVQEYARVLAEAVLNGHPVCSAASVQLAIAKDDRSKALREAVGPLIDFEIKATLDALNGDIDPLCDLLDLGNLASLSAEMAPDRPALREAISVSLLRIGKLRLPGSDTICVRHFGGQYFSYAQAAELDAIADFARDAKNPVLLAAALSTASHLVNSIGKQFAQPIRPRDKAGIPKRHVIKKIVAERRLSARTTFARYLEQYQDQVHARCDHVAVRADFRDALANPPFKPAVVYADPPYTRDHYSRFYHSLETLALGDEPTITKSNLGGRHIDSRGGYREGRHQSPFCIKSQAPDAFVALFAGVAKLRVPLVLSYSGYDPRRGGRPRVMPLDALIGLAKEHFLSVDLEQVANLEHSKLNTTSLNKSPKSTSEVLLLCR